MAQINLIQLTVWKRLLFGFIPLLWKDGGKQLCFPWHLENTPTIS